MLLVVISIIATLFLTAASVVGWIYYKKNKRLDEKIKKLRKDKSQWIE